MKEFRTRLNRLLLDHLEARHICIVYEDKVQPFTEEHNIDLEDDQTFSDAGIEQFPDAQSFKDFIAESYLESARHGLNCMIQMPWLLPFHGGGAAGVRDKIRDDFRKASLSPDEDESYRKVFEEHFGLTDQKTFEAYYATLPTIVIDPHLMM